jgi:hypothetical protein
MTIKTGDYTKIKMNNRLKEPDWEYALTENEAAIISAFLDVNDELSTSANSEQELYDAAPIKPAIDSSIARLSV